MSEEKRAEHLLALRDAVLTEMASADLAYSEIRMRVECMESDLRIGRPQPSDYPQAKGRMLPQAEAKVLDLFQELLKLEDKLNAARQS